MTTRCLSSELPTLMGLKSLEVDIASSIVALAFKSALSVGLQVFVDYGDVYDCRVYLYHYES